CFWVVLRLGETPLQRAQDLPLYAQVLLRLLDALLGDVPEARGVVGHKGELVRLRASATGRRRGRSPGTLTRLLAAPESDRGDRGERHEHASAHDHRHLSPLVFPAG